MNVDLDPDGFLSLYPAQSVVLISTSYGAISNIAPYAWHMPVSMEPPLVAVAVRGSRDTYSNILEGKEFVICVVGPEHLEDVRRAARSLPRDRSEFDICRLTPIKSRIVHPPSVGEAQVNMECVLHSESGAGDHRIIVGRVVAVTVREDVATLGIERSSLDPLYHLSSSKGEYARLGDALDG